MKLTEIKMSDREWEKTQDEASDRMSRLPLSKDGYKIERLKKLHGMFVGYYEDKRVQEGSAYDVAKDLEDHMKERYPDIKIPFLYHPEDKSNNLSISDSEGNYMDAEMKQLSRK